MFAEKVSREPRESQGLMAVQVLMVDQDYLDPLDHLAS